MRRCLTQTRTPWCSTAAARSANLENWEKIENQVSGFEVMAACSMTQTTTKPAGFFCAFRTKLNRFLALETADLKSSGSS